MQELESQVGEAVSVSRALIRGESGNLIRKAGVMPSCRKAERCGSGTGFA